MNTALRTFVLVSGVSLSISSLGACRDDAPKPIGDVLAQDSTLTLEVMSANGDSAIPQADSLAVATDSGIPVSAPSVPVARAESAPAETSRLEAVPVKAAPARDVAASRPTRRTARVAVSHPPSRSSRISRSRARTAQRPQPAASAPSVAVGTRGEILSTSTDNDATVAARTSGIVATGSELDLVAGQRVCSYASRVGDEFTALLTEPVVGTNGTVIPKGAMAVAEIASLRKKGDGRIGLRISSVTFNGRTYPVTSEVTYAEMEKTQAKRRTSSRTVAAGAGAGAIIGGVIGGGAGSAVLGAAGGAVAGAAAGKRTVRADQCIPERGQITAQLTAPLAI